MVGSSTAGTPRVVFWMKIYALFNSLLWFSIIPVVYLGFGFSLGPTSGGFADTLARVIVFVPLLLLALLFAVMIFLPKNKFTWLYGFPVVALGSLSLFVIPFSIALLVFWCKQNTRNYYALHQATPR